MHVKVYVCVCGGGGGWGGGGGGGRGGGGGGGGGVRMSPGAMVGDIFLYDLDLSRNIKVRDALGSDQFYVCFL